MKYQNFFFDLGNTLTDSGNIPESFFKTVIKDLNPDVRQEIGMRFIDRIESFYLAGTEVQADWRKIFIAIYEDMKISLEPEKIEKQARQLLTGYTGYCLLKKYSVEILRELQNRDKKMVLVSNVTGPVEVFDNHLKNLGISGYFDTVVWSSGIGYRKPSEIIFDVAVRRSGAAIEESVFIGDSEEADICGAKKAGMDSILLSDVPRTTDADWNFNQKELLDFFRDGDRL